MDISKSQLSVSHLKMICELDRCETVKEAAQALFISQPALTNRIREAERRLNTPLFFRRGRKIIMSNAGKRLLYSAKKILQELSRAEHDIARLTDGIEQVLRVGLPHYASFQWLPAVMKGFHQRHQQIELEISAQMQEQPLNALYNHEIDIAMVSTAEPSLVVDDKQFGSVCLVEDELVACLSKEHPKAQQAFLQVEDFADETYVTNSTVPEKDREYELFFKPRNVLPKKVLQVGFNDAIIELVKANIGISIFSKRQIAHFVDNRQQQDIAMLPLDQQGLTLYWHLIYLNQSPIAEPAHSFAEIIQQELAQVIHK
ncbi:LysR family transcriptional regulator [Thalassotalea sp. G2M2-11]|uniref:LysR family transcriptional regulator n=1 Tax=Thalassotalea sp. G2M2-11 TaxID=2787627 RepID=UPI0019D0263A|nr:LysR family transcriptional regulator [Thalassotalea sp. G2M2-11]